MKLRNKKTGEIKELQKVIHEAYKQHEYDSLAELNEEWEDVPEEPKEFWFVDSGGEVEEATYLTENDKANLANFGNYFETEEEAEKAVEKLKAWKRLKDKGFRFTGFTRKDRGRLDELEIYCQLGERPENIEDMEDVCLLFGGEE